MNSSDPIFPAILAADMASVAHTATLVFRDEDDTADMERSEAAGRAVDQAFETVRRTTPTTLAGLLTLVRFYARDAKIYCRWDTGGDYLERVASALEVFVAREAQAPLSLTEVQIREATGVPGQAEITAAWHALPPETRDRIGIIAVDMVFQAFVYGDAYVASEQFEDLPVYDPDIREAAAEASDRRLTELHKIVEDALPDLFGKDENPAWSENPGTVPTEAARAWAETERAELAARKSRLENELAAEDSAAASAVQTERALAEALRAARFALAIDDHYNVRDFLDGWLKGDTAEWPEFAEGATEPRDESEADHAAA